MLAPTRPSLSQVAIGSPSVSVLVTRMNIYSAWHGEDAHAVPSRVAWASPGLKKAPRVSVTGD